MGSLLITLSGASLKSSRILMLTLASLMDLLVTRLISKHQTTTMKNTGLLVASDSRMVLMNSCPSISSSIQNPVKRSLICVLRTLATVLQPLGDHGINSGDKHFNLCQHYVHYDAFLVLDLQLRL